MREQGLVIQEPGVSSGSDAAVADAPVRTFEEAVSRDTANENARAIGMMFAPLKGVKGAGGRG